MCYNILRGPLGPRDYLLAVLIDSLGSRLSRKILTTLSSLPVELLKKRASSQTDQKVNAPLPPCKLKTKNLKQLVSLATASQQHLINPSKPLCRKIFFPAARFSIQHDKASKGEEQKKRPLANIWCFIAQLFWIFSSKNYSKLKTLCWHGSVQVLLLLKL